MWSSKGTDAYHRLGVSDAKAFERCPGGRCHVRAWRDDRPGGQPSLPLCQRQHQQWWRPHRCLQDAGLGTGVSSVKVTLHADANAEFQRWNNGSKHPKAGNKETVAGPLVSTGDFPVSHGQVTASISGGPLGPGSFACPSGQTLYLMSITYSNISVSDETGNSASATPSTVSSGPTMIAV
jgi:hypothetical protein